MKLTGREKKEVDDLKKLIELRKNYLAKKGKKPTSKKVTVSMKSALEKKEAADYKKLEVLRRRYLTNVKKSKIPKDRKIKSVKEIDTVAKEIQRKIPEGRGINMKVPKKKSVSVTIVTVKPGESRADIKKRVKGTPKNTKASLSDEQKKTQVRKRKIPEGRSINMTVPKKKRKIPEGRSINMKVPKSVSKMSLKEKLLYFNKNADNPVKIKKGTKKTSAGTFVTYPQFTLAEYLKMSKHDRYLVGLPENPDSISKNTRNIVVKIK